MLNNYKVFNKTNPPESVILSDIWNGKIEIETRWADGGDLTTMYGI